MSEMYQRDNGYVWSGNISGRDSQNIRFFDESDWESDSQKRISAFMG